MASPQTREPYLLHLLLLQLFLLVHQLAHPQTKKSLTASPQRRELYPLLLLKSILQLVPLADQLAYQQTEKTLIMSPQRREPYLLQPSPPVHQPAHP